MRSLIVVAVSVLCMGCGDIKFPLNPFPEPVSPFEHELSTFSVYYGHDVTHYPILFGDATTQFYGACFGEQIFIDRANWSIHPELHEQIVFHYLGACLLKRSEMWSGDTIMNINLVDPSLYSIKRLMYINELIYGTPIN